MTDLSVVAKVTRTYLDLEDLDINTGYYRIAGPDIMSGQVTWQRQQVSAPWVDGEVTVARRRGNVMEPLTVYVTGSDQSTLNTNIQDLIWAFTQDRYTLSITIGAQQHDWDCEAADYSVRVSTPYMKSLYVPVTFQIMRKPLPLLGAF